MNSALETPQSNPQFETEKPVNRACEACRLLKVRCLPDETGSTAKCHRCKKSGRMCVYLAPQKRRQRIRTDTRVAELERQIRDMRAMLIGGGNGIGEQVAENKSLPATPLMEKNPTVEVQRSSVGSDRSSSGGIDAEGQTSRQIFQPHTPKSDSPAAPGPVEKAGDEFGLLAPETADWLFNSFKNDLAPHFPAVIVSPDTSPEEMRKSKPILFQAMVTAAAYQLDSETLVALFQEMTKVYAHRIFMNGEKSLEIVQAMNTSVLWYCPPDDGCDHGNLQFYQYIHMAATMAIDLGIGTNLDSSATCLEECRTLLACYLNCTGVALRMRRPNMLAWTDYMGKCLELIESSPLAVPLDQCLVAWVKLQRITSDWSSVIRSTGLNGQVTLNGYQGQREKWKDENLLAAHNVSLSLSYHQDNIYVHECILEGGPTSLMDFPKTRWEHSSLPTPKYPLGPVYLNAVTVCVDSSHSLLDLFLSLDMETLQGAPVIFYVRMAYAIIVLVKLCLAASAPSSELGQVLDPQTLKVDYYITMALGRLTQLAGPKKRRVPQKWLTITSVINKWYQGTMIGFTQAQNSEWLQPTASVIDGSSTSIADNEDRYDGAGWPIRTLDHPCSKEPNTALPFPNRVAASAAAAAERPSNTKPKSAPYDYASWATPSTITSAGAEFNHMDMISEELSFLDDSGMPLPNDNDMFSFEPGADDWNLDYL